MFIVGLGNPGAQYYNTIHNIGFDVIDRLSDKLCNDIVWNKKFDVLYNAINCENFHDISGLKKIMLIKPQTYMNNSGIGIMQILKFFKVDLLTPESMKSGNPHITDPKMMLPKRNLFVIYDDVDIAIGKIKLKLGGSSAGHNGVKSIDQYVGNNNYIKIRVGAKSVNQPKDPMNYVLSSISKLPEEESRLLYETMDRMVYNFYHLLKFEYDQFLSKVNI